MPVTQKQQEKRNTVSMNGPLPAETFPAISDYAVIGDCRIAALISRDGAVEWLCLPHFSGESIFAAILDRRIGGHFSIRPSQPYRVSRNYIDNSNVLVTTFTTDSGVVQLSDCIPIMIDQQFLDLLQPQRELLRCIECVSGLVEMQIEFVPRPGYGQKPVTLRSRGALGWQCIFGNQSLNLHSNMTLQCSNDRTVLTGQVVMQADDHYELSLS
jgi:GH15 family glucan-1,4-alpha-glucosidase